MRSVIVYNDFYSDPVQVRNRALEGGFEAPRGSNYPGRNSVITYRPDGMIDFFSDLIGHPVKPSANSHCGGFRIQYAGDTGRQLIHVDLPSMATRWAGVCYLTPCNHKAAGTSFWRHRRTGMEEMPYDTKYLASIGLNGPDDLYQFMNTEGTDETLWDSLWTIPFQFNRLIVFRSNLWHSQGEIFGDSDDTGRLIQTFFFEPAT